MGWQEWIALGIGALALGLLLRKLFKKEKDCPGCH
jgi:hypothetical protein